MKYLAKRISCILIFLCFTSSARATDPPFPSISEIELEFYQTEVQVTDLVQNVAAYASEYYDGSGNRGRVNLLALGERKSIFYNNDTNQLLDISGTKCEASEVKLSIWAYEPLFYGWLNKDPLVIGPSAPLWYASIRKDEVVYNGTEKIRGINCDKWYLPINDERDDITISYFFADDKWTTPYQFEGLRVPIRIEVTGNSSRDVKDAEQRIEINLWTDFAYFRPTIDNWQAFQPPVGLGCPGRDETRKMPKFPKTFRYSAEVFDVLQTDPDNKELTYDVEYQQVYYDYENKMARLDKYSRTRIISELYDFNTGVTYTNVNGESCTTKPLRNSEFEAYDNQMMGHMKEPEEVLNLDGTFYYMGKRLLRGIWCDTFESATTNVTFMKKDLDKLVITMYYSEEYYIANVKGETETRIPVFYVITGYDKPGHVAINLQYNIFEFSDVIWPDMFTSFDMDRCFPSIHDKSYFVLYFEVKPEIARQMEKMDELIIESIREAIMKEAKISALRLPMLKADYKVSGVYVTGVMLGRPPAMTQFYREFTGETVTDDKFLKPAIEADTKESCAYSCVGNDDFTCLGFYWCNQACFLKSKGLFEPQDNPDRRELGNCETWMRVTRDSTNEESYLIEALQRLEYAVTNGTFFITLFVKYGDKDAEQIIPVTQVVIGGGPYSGKNSEDLPYDRVIKFAKLDATDESTQDVSYVSNLNDCYQACKTSESMSCASFSYCLEASEQKCLISSDLIVSRKNNPDDTVDDNDCYVYSLKYLDFYVAYPGKSILIGGEDVAESVKTTEECAKVCREEKKFLCRGFEFCRTQKTCVLHSKHVMDLKPGELGDGGKKSTCTHYAAKFSADYYDMGYTLIDDTSDVRNEITLEECSRACSEEEQAECKSFNYCPASAPYMTDSTCALSKKVLKDDRVTTTTKDKCHHFEKKESVDDWAKSRKKPLITSGYTSRGFTGLVMGMLALGLIVGALGFVGYSFYRSRSSGDGMSVRFMKQPT